MGALCVAEWTKGSARAHVPMRGGACRHDASAAAGSGGRLLIGRDCQHWEDVARSWPMLAEQ